VLKSKGGISDQMPSKIFDGINHPVSGTRRTILIPDSVFASLIRRFLLAITFCVIGFSVLAADVDLKSIYARARPGVVLITTSNPSGVSIALGTGFAVADGKKIVTNLHVIQGATTVNIKTGDNRQYETTHVFGYDVVHDLAVLDCPVPLPQLRLSEEQPSVGDVILTIGNPQGLEGSLSEGLVSGLRQLQGSTVYQISAAISPGSSGGPLLNQRGEVIAVTSFAVRGGENLNFAIPIRYVSPLLGETSKTSISALAPENSSQRPFKDEVKRLWNQGLKTLARKKAAEFVEQHPNDRAATRYVADLMFFSADWDAAIRLYETTIDLNPESSLDRNYCWLAIALAHRCMNRYDESLSAFQHLGPKSDFGPELLWEIYVTELAAERFESARATAKILMTERNDDKVKGFLRLFANYSQDQLAALGRDVSRGKSKRLAGAFKDIKLTRD